MVQDSSRTEGRWNAALVASAAFIQLLIVARAQVQSITMDEANTYLQWAALAWPSHWVPASNNHVFNSSLVRLFTTIFGVSHLAVRLPALIGSVVFLLATLACSVVITESRPLRLVLFLSVAANPFVLDYLVAARGYSLAVAFLMLAIALPAYWHMRRGEAKRPPYGVYAVASACLGASFVSNFSFAFADAAALTAIFVWAAWKKPLRASVLARLAAAFALPALLTALLLGGTILFQFNSGEFVVGAKSLGETFRALVEDSLHEPNAFLLNPLLLRAAQQLAHLVLPLAAAALILALGAIVARRIRRGPAPGYRPAAFGMVLTATLVMTLALHWAAFRWFGLPLPKDRTALFLAPLCTLIAGVIAAAAAAAFRKAATVALALVALYFVGCFRVTYFQEWKYCAEMKQAYEVIAYYNHACGMRRDSASEMYSPSLNFYRALSGRETLGEFIGVSDSAYPPDRDIYVVHAIEYRELLEQKKLQAVWHGEYTDVVVALRPASAAACAAR